MAAFHPESAAGGIAPREVARGAIFVTLDSKEAVRCGEFLEVDVYFGVGHQAEPAPKTGGAPPCAAQHSCMAAKRKVKPPKPRLDLPWTELTKAQQNLLYTRALQAYADGTGPNPATKTEYSRAQVAAKA
jgi:hypothetical protein